MVPSASTDYKHLAGEHVQLKGLLGDLRTFLGAERPAVEAADARRWSHDLCERLLSLQDRLFHHFRAEEQSGAMERLGRRFPQALPTLESLRKEHDRILQDVNSLLGAAMIYAEGRPPDNPHLRTWTQSLLDRIGAHEGQETELLQRLHYEDLGSSGD